MNPAKALKAARLAVVQRRDGSYNVAGDTATYTVRYSPHTSRYYCDCRAGHGCSHTLAVSFHLERSKQKAVI